MLEKCKDCCFIAEVDGKIIGSAFGMHDGAFRGYIQKIAVAEKYRKQKIATKILEKIVDRFEKIGIPLIFTLVEPDNEPSIKLLESLGFRKNESRILIDKGFKLR